MAKTLLRPEQSGTTKYYWDASSISYINKKSGVKKDLNGLRLPAPAAAESTEAIPANKVIKMEIPFGTTFKNTPAVVASVSN